MNRWIPTLAIVPALVAAAPAFDPEPFVRDVAHSQINFVAVSRLVDAHGTFDSWNADIQFDADKVEATTFNISIDAKSINTRIEMRDNHLRSNDFFATDSFPTITFKSAFINKLSDDRINITGDLTIRGQTKRITIPARLVFFDKERKVGRVKGETTIIRQDYGVSFQSPVNPIESEVKVQFDVAFAAKK